MYNLNSISQTFLIGRGGATTPWHTADIDPNITKIDIDIDFISVLCYKIP